MADYGTIQGFGGLSIGNIFHRNPALLFKWIWKFLNDPSSLWRQVISQKYKYPHDSVFPKHDGPWKKIYSAVLKNDTIKEVALKGLRTYGLGLGL